MIRKLSRNIHSYYLLAFLCLISCMCYFAYEYKKSNLYDINLISSIYESSNSLSDVKKRDEIGKIYDLVFDDKIKDASKLLYNFEDRISQLNVIRPDLQSYRDLQVESDKLKRQLTKLLAYSDIASVTRVFHNKISKFSEYCFERKWVNLTRISTKMVSRFADQKDLSNEKLKVLLKYTQQDVNSMKSLIEISGLDKNDISNINLRLQSFQVELEMMKNFLDERERFSEFFNAYEKAYGVWNQEIDSEISLAKLRWNHENKKFVLAFMTMVVLAFGLMVMGPFFERLFSRKNSEKIEDYILALIKHRLMSGDSQMQASSQGLSQNKKFKLDQHHASFLNEVDKIHHFLKRRLSFSAIFQHTLPFPAILLDSNLKVIWANNQFCEAFRLDAVDVNQKSLSWDYLLRFTNLGDTDPVLDSLQNDINGLYQILVKVDKNAPARPYEMYVVPYHPTDGHSISAGANKSMMIFFYSLTSMEETIKNQGMTLIDPINRSIEMAIRDDFTPEFFKNIKSDFELAGISDIYEKFERYTQKVSMEKTALLSQMQHLEITVDDYKKIFADVNVLTDQFIIIVNRLFDNIKSLKKDSIEYIESCFSLKGHHEEAIDNNKDVIDEISRLAKDFEMVLCKMVDSKTSISGLLHLRNDLKTQRQNVHVINSRMVQSLDQLLIFEKTEEIEKHKLEQAVSKLKTDVRNLSKEILVLEKTMTTLDIQLSKTEVILDSGEKFSAQNNTATFQQMQDRIMEFKQVYDDHNFERSQTLEQNNYLEEKFVKDVQQLFESYKKLFNNGIDQKDVLSGLSEYFPRNTEITHEESAAATT